MTPDPKELLKLYEPKEVKALTTDQQLCNLRFSPCGKFLMAGDFNGLVRRWDATTDELTALESLTGHGGFVDGLCFHPQGQWLYTADSWGRLRAWNYAEPSPQPKWDLPEAHDGWIRWLSASPDGKLLASCGRDRHVRVWNAEDGRKLHDFEGHADDIHRVLFHPDGKSLVSGDLKGVVKHWSIETGKHVRDLDAGALYKSDRLQDVGGVQCLAFDPEGKLLAVGGTQPKGGGNVQGSATVVLFEFAEGKKRPLVTMGADIYVHDLHLDARGFLVAVTSGNPGAGTLILQHLEATSPFYTTTKMSNCHSLAVHPSGLRLAVTATNKGSNGNGRVKSKDGEYPGNWSPVHIFDLPKPAEPPAAASG